MTNRLSYCIVVLALTTNLRYTVAQIVKSTDVTGNLEFNYKGFYGIANSNNCNQLIFTIENKTRDTIYLPFRDINILVFKNNTILKEDSLPNHGIPPIFLHEQFLTLSTYEPTVNFITAVKGKQKIADRLKMKYAKTLYKRNFTNGVMPKNFLYSVLSECIVLLPKDKLNCSALFVSKQLDVTCQVKLFYIKSAVFAMYDDYKGNQVKVKY